MLTGICKNELPNPYKNTIRNIMNTLICYEHDIQRVNIELRQMQDKFNAELEKLQFHCDELCQPTCDSSDSPGYVSDFAKHIDTIDEVNRCFNEKLEILKKERDTISTAAQQCFRNLQLEKKSFKHFHENTVDYMKQHALKSTDPQTILNCERDICEMHRLFIDEVAFIKKSEVDMKEFLRDLEGNEGAPANYCCFKEFDWLPKGKGMCMVDRIEENIKSTMGATLRRAFAQLHLQNATDPKNFLATYLVSMERNEEMVKKKINLFGLTNN